MLLVTYKNRHLRPIQLTDISFSTGFWADRQAVNRNKTIPSIYKQLKATGRLDAWLQEPGRQAPKQHKVVHMFWDSDTGKWLEAVAYSLHTHPDPALEAQADEVISRMEKAQHPDGYLNTYFTVVDPENQWRNLRDWHEMYNAGHLLEGAVAYYQATGKSTVLDVLKRFIDLIDQRYGPNEGQERGYDGHPEVELALVKLYRETGNERYLNLSKYFIDERGQEPHFFDIEARKRGDDPELFWAKSYHYCQAHQPLREQNEAVGHAVRACYLYAGVADIALETNDESLLTLSRKLWNDLTQHQMYITGGLGPAQSNEGFTFAYDLPNETAYAETCASIALALWAHRMFHLDPDSRYIDVMERALYNTVLSGVSHEGDHFFYANPLSAYPHVNPHDPWVGITSGEHYKREEWFYCPCCPPNVARIVASIGTYFYSSIDQTIYIHLYSNNQSRFVLNGSTIQLEQKTNYPWDENIQISVSLEQTTVFELALRIPNWCRAFTLSVNGEAISASLVKGYVHIQRQWANGDNIQLFLSMPVERMSPHPEIRQDAGCIALQRGPIVYCLEEVDNVGRLANVTIPRGSSLSVEFDASLFDGVTIIKGDAVRIEPENWSGDLYQPQAAIAIKESPFKFTAIPYCFWANRQIGEMRVWIREN
jgi:uncharacterized protein